MRRLWLILALLPAMAAAREGVPSYDRDTALAVSQAAIGRELADHRFTDQHGQPLGLAELRGRPLVVSLIYTSCYHVCPMLTTELKGVVEIAREALGEDSFAVLTIGFDTAVDTPQRMRSFARGRGIDDPGWHFAAADAATMAALTEELGFIYFASPKGFDHLAQTTIVDAGGQVYRQVYGDSFDAPQLVEPLKALVFNRHPDRTTLAGWLEGVRLFCTVYDPRTGRYRFDYSLFVTIGVGLLCLGGLAIFIVQAWRDGGPSRPVT